MGKRDWKLPLLYILRTLINLHNVILIGCLTVYV